MILLKNFRRSTKKSSVLLYKRTKLNLSNWSLFLFIGCCFLFYLFIAKDDCSVATSNTIFIYRPDHFSVWYADTNYATQLTTYTFQDCPVKCKWSMDEIDFCSSKGVIIEGNMVNKISKFPNKKPRNQKWFCYTQEPYVEHLNDSLLMSFYEEKLVSYEPDSFAPIPYFQPKFQEYTPVTFKDADAPVAMFISNCGSKGRLDYITELMKYIKVDSYGKCLNNKKLPNDLPKADWNEGAERKFFHKISVISHYKFYLAFENCNVTDYVTEKLVHGFEATSLPIYMGAPNIDEFLPHPKSIIKTKDFKSPQHLAIFLNRLAQNDKEYEEYFEWKRNPESWQLPKSQKPRTCKYCTHTWQCRTCLKLHGLL